MSNKYIYYNYIYCVISVKSNVLNLSLNSSTNCVSCCSLTEHFFQSERSGKPTIRAQILRGKSKIPAFFGSETCAT
jgi:hypothetical protein